MNSEKIKERNNISSLLRFIGLTSVFIAGATFMIQGWKELADLNKYLHFFAFVVVLSGLSMLFHGHFKDRATARVFSVLSALGITTLFSQIASVIYSSPYPASHEVPGIFNLAIPLPDFLVMGIITGLLTIPVTFMGFHSLIKSKYVESSILYLLLNAVLLIPSREPQWTSLFLLIQFLILGIGYKELKIQSSIHDKWNRLGFFSLMTAPALTLLIRSMYYPKEAYFFGMVFAVIGTTLVFVPAKTSVKEDVPLHRCLVGLGYLSYLVSWLIFSNEFERYYRDFLGLGIWRQYLENYIFYGGCALISIVVYKADTPKTHFYRDAVVFWLNLLVWKTIFGSHNLTIHMVGFLISAVLIYYSVLQKFKWLTAMSVLSLIFCFTYFTDIIANLYEKSPWLFFAVLGVVLILISAFYNRIAEFISQILHSQRSHLSSPEEHDLRQDSSKI